MNFAHYDEAIAMQLAPVRDQLKTVPVAALPNEAGTMATEDFESIDWLIPSYQAEPPDAIGDSFQDVTVTLLVRLYFKKRYPKGQERDVLEWAETQVLQLLTGYRLPDAQSDIRLVSGRLYAPSKGVWFKEIEFSFKAQIVPIKKEPEKVKIIGSTVNKMVVEEVIKKDAT